ncbi:MAG: aspartate kinase [Actinobacteria bacterium]|nr:aspartate kinase [Actinomycetota bacterium]
MNKNIIVMKFGGTSVGTIEKIKNVADRAIKSKSEGNNVVITVSAMGDTTDELIELASKISKNPPRREMDMLLSTGEQVSAALLAIAITEKGGRAVSLNGYQVGISTDDVFSDAKILTVKKDRIVSEFEKGNIVIVAGFQGITDANDITTLGRGGSDTTAVAVAAALNAKYCEIFTDVDGVFTTDPNVVSDAMKIKILSYDEMLELASSGAKVLHLRAVEFAKNHGVVIHVRSSFNNNEGTWIMDTENLNEKMEKAVVAGVSYDTNQVKISVFGIPDKPGIAAKLFEELAKAHINIDMIVQNVGEKGIAAISFTIKNEDLNTGRKVMEELKHKLEIKNIEIDTEIAKVSIVGAGMKSHPGVAAAMFSALGDKGINIEMISTSPIIISCVIRKERVKEAVKLLHNAFGLDKQKL